ncbi:MAG: hypothetical protein WAQ28_02040 [Bacteroidia bacterium]
MSLKDCPITAVAIFHDTPGAKKYFRGDRYEKENHNMMVYNLRKMFLKMGLEKIKELQIFDNTKMTFEDRVILHCVDGIVIRNDLETYLGKDYNPKAFK